MTATVEVLDAMMGTGKSEGIIAWMNSNPQHKYLYVSPMLSEVEDRIPTKCAALEFVFPHIEEHRTKSDCLLSYLKEGRNVAFSHSLFYDMTEEHLTHIERKGYTLIIDEEVSLIQSYDGTYTAGDIVSLEQAGHIRVDEDNLGRVVWQWYDSTENTAYSRLKRLCDMEMLYCAKRDRDMLVIHLPIRLVRAAHRTIVLTYLFSGSVMENFLKLRDIDVTPFTDVNLIISSEDARKRAVPLVELISTPTTNKVMKWSQSLTWYEHSASKEQKTMLSNAIRSVYRKWGNMDNFLFTMPKNSVYGSRPIINRKHTPIECWLYSSCRATNDYAHKTVLVHAYNRYINTPIKGYLQDYGFPPDDDNFALSEMIQWVWRSAIRNGEPVKLCITNQRMLTLFSNWLYK